MCFFLPLLLIYSEASDGRVSRIKLYNRPSLIVFVDIVWLVIFNFKNFVDAIFAELLFRFSGVSRLDELNDCIFGVLGASLSCQILCFHLTFGKMLAYIAIQESLIRY